MAKVGDSSFPELEDFLKDLGTWSEHLKNFTSTTQMKNIYNFVKKEYTTKTVSQRKNFSSTKNVKNSFTSFISILLKAIKTFCKFYFTNLLFPH